MKLFFFIFAVSCVVLTEVSLCQGVNLTFPENFAIGAATASYQIEGAWNVSDKGESTWDYFTHNRSELMEDGSTGDVACNSYYKYQEDVQWIRELGLDFYRFSISWTRVLPTGFADKVSADGIQYYKNLIQELLNYNITPIVTIYHWDHPQILEEMGGWTNEMMVEWYADYARVIFTELGPMVKTFITLNEPKIYCTQGYNETSKAPAKVLENMGHYICVHNSLKAHATAWHMYDEEFRPTQQGEVGLVTPCDGFVTGDGTSDASIEQFFQFECGWIMHPIFIGDYPEIMKTRIAMISELESYPFSRLPEFTDEWIEYIKGTYDFFGLNHYTSIMPVFDADENLGVYNIDSGIISVKDANWPMGSASWSCIVPEGFGNLLRMIKDQYDNPRVYIFENGFPDWGELEDYNRMIYYYEYLTELLTAIYDDDCNVQKYTIWSLIDNFEWQHGYTQKFGIISVDFNSDDRTRTSKLSTSWWKDVLGNRTLQDVPTANSS